MKDFLEQQPIQFHKMYKKKSFDGIAEMLQISQSNPHRWKISIVAGSRRPGMSTIKTGQFCNHTTVQIMPN